MKIIIKEDAAPTLMSIQNFADLHGLTFEVTANPAEQVAKGRKKYRGSFQSVEVKDGGCLRGVYGEGAEVSSTLADYAKQISGTQIVVGAYTNVRKEIMVPTLTVDPIVLQR